MKIVTLAGGVGGAKFLSGLTKSVVPEDVTAIVNTGDDFWHWGLFICPDLDTVCYNLADISDPSSGWGRKEETWNALENMKLLGAPAWFNLGDKDLATHIERTRRKMAGDDLSKIVGHFCTCWNVPIRVLPMTDNYVPTIIVTNENGELPFQKYFVEMKCEPSVRGFRYENADHAKPGPDVIESIDVADLIIICPSNPWLSIQPILSIPGIQDAISKKPVVAISPIVRGNAIKGPAAKIFAELGMEPSTVTVCSYYKGLIKGFILDEMDWESEHEINKWGIRTLVTDTIMNTHEKKINLAVKVIDFCHSLLV